MAIIATLVALAILVSIVLAAIALGGLFSRGARRMFGTRD